MGDDRRADEEAVTVKEVKMEWSEYFEGLMCLVIGRWKWCV